MVLLVWLFIITPIWEQVSRHSSSELDVYEPLRAIPVHSQRLGRSPSVGLRQPSVSPLLGLRDPSLYDYPHQQTSASNQRRAISTTPGRPTPSDDGGSRAESY
jgi:hypothetical protein